MSRTLRLLLTSALILLLVPSVATANAAQVVTQQPFANFGPRADFPTGGGPNSVAIGDLNGDGLLDVATANSAETVSILFGNGAGSLDVKHDYDMGRAPHSLVVGDLNGDGVDDLVAANATGWNTYFSVSVRLGSAVGSQPVIGSERARDFNAIALGDLDGDGRLDLAAANRDGSISILLGNGFGNFVLSGSYGTDAVPYGVAVSDLNGDGNLDVVATIPGLDAVAILLSNGNGTFGDVAYYTTGGTPQLVALGDFDGEGTPDLVTTLGTTRAVAVLLGNGDGSFRSTTYVGTDQFPLSVVVGDLNRDGSLDLAVPCIYYDLNFVSILFNDGSGTFGAPVTFGSGTGVRDVAIGDLNRDGWADLATANSSNTVSVFLNQTDVVAPDGIWSLLGPQGSPPSARDEHTAIYDPVRERMVVFGGRNGDARNDVWVQALAGTSTWTQLLPTGGSPSPRGSHSAIYDPLRDRMVVFGGAEVGGVPRNDVWALTLAGTPAWTQLLPVGRPPGGRKGHTAIYDPVHDRMVVFGGEDESAQAVNEVWALSLSGIPTWTQLIPDGAPPSPRYSHTAIYDPARDHMVVFDGNDGASFFSDAWTLSLAEPPTWTQLSPAGTPPSARERPTAIYDPVRDRMVVFAGGGVGGVRNDVWVLTLAGTPTWTQLSPAGTPPSARFRHTAIYDPARDRMAVFGGWDGLSLRNNDTWALTWGTPAPADQAPVVSAPATYAGVEGSPMLFNVIASDPDGDPMFSLTVSGLPSGASFTTDVGHTIGSFTWTPAVGQAGSHVVQFTASNALTGNASTNIAVSPRPNQAPICSLSAPLSATVCTPVLFDATGSSDADGTITSYRWTFGDDEGAEGGSVTHVYQSSAVPGSYSVTLTITDDGGESSTCVSQVLVEAPTVLVSGRVARLNGQPIGGAIIRAYLPQAEGTPRLVSESSPSAASDGSFELRLPPASDYALRCDHVSFWDETATGIVVCPGEPIPIVNFAMVKRDEMTGIVRSRYDGFTSGTLPSTRLTVELRAPSAGTFQVRYQAEDDEWLVPPSGITGARRVAKGESWTEEFLIALKHAPPAPSPIAVNIELLRTGVLGTSTRVESDILRMIVDSPLSDNPASGLDDLTAQALLRRFQPTFALHGTEPWTPKAVDIMLDRATMAFADDPIGDMKGGVGRGMIAGWQTLNSVGPPTLPYLDLYGDGQAKAGSRKAGEEYVTFERNYPDVVYGTAVEANGGLYLSYWCFYFFEAWSIATHEGDWEGVTILLRKAEDGWTPESVFFSHHPTPDNNFRTLERLAWEDVEVMPVNGRRVPIVYVAEQAHGSYPHRRLKPSVPAPGEDYYDGAGPRILPFDSPRCGAPFCADRYARLDYLPRLNKIGGSHPALWALFGGSYGFTSVQTPISAFFQPLGPPMTGNAWRWTSPGMWIANVLNSSNNVQTHEESMSPGAPTSPPRARAIVRMSRAGADFAIETDADAHVRIQIVDVAGRLVRTLAAAGGSQTHRVSWDLGNAGGLRVASGVYFYKTEISTAGNRSKGPGGKIVVLR